MESYQNTASDEEIFLVHVPALVAVLLVKEKDKGSPLTEEEVIEIRDQSQCIAMPLYAKRKVDEGRGYIDIDPGNVWEEWQAARADLVGS